MLGPQTQRIELLTRMAERLIEAIEGDLAALKAGKPQEMRTLDPEVQRLSASYGREAAGLTAEIAKQAPAVVRGRFFDATKRFKELLELHARMVTSVRNASEGVIKAVADEVNRQAQPMRTYDPRAASYGKPARAMVYNSVV